MSGDGRPRDLSPKPTWFRVPGTNGANTGFASHPTSAPPTAAAVTPPGLETTTGATDDDTASYTVTGLEQDERADVVSCVWD